MSKETFLEKLQKLPVATKKIILWTTVVVISIIFFMIWIRSFQGKMKTLQSADFQNKINQIKDLK